jgi:hypothetical protein
MSLSDSIPVSLKLWFWQEYMIKILRVEVMWIGVADLLDISVFTVRILGEDIFLTQEESIGNGTNCRFI